MNQMTDLVWVAGMSGVCLFERLVHLLSLCSWKWRPFLYLWWMKKQIHYRLFQNQWQQLPDMNALKEWAFQCCEKLKWQFYLLLTEFEDRSVSYGPSFMACALHAWVINRTEKWGSVVYSTNWKNEREHFIGFQQKLDFESSKVQNIHLIPIVHNNTKLHKKSKSSTQMFSARSCDTKFCQ